MITPWLISLKGTLVLLAGVSTIETVIKTGKWKGIRFMTKEISNYTFDHQHRAILGVTRHGKTYFAINTAKKHKGAVFFFNVQHEKVPSPFITFDPNIHDMGQLTHILRYGEKVNFLVDVDRGKAEKQLKAIQNLFYNQLQNIEILCLWDEVHLFKKEGREALITLATTGLRWGKRCLFMTQRGANMDNNLLTQSTEYIFFALSPNDLDYLKKLGYPVDDLNSICNDKYIFCTMNQRGEVKGGFKLKV